jgi:hypothetical protein
MSTLYKFIGISIIVPILLINHSIDSYANSPYQITSFHSQIELNQDTTLTVTENIQVNFSEPRHGLFRTIPIIYSARGQTIKAGFKTFSITDKQSNPIPYQKSRQAQSIELKIGDPDLTITGPQTYVIKYQISDIVLIYNNQPEIYWNVTGHEWDTDIPNPTAEVTSNHADIIQTTCFAGLFQSQQQNCQSTFTLNQARFASHIPTGQNSDFTIVIGLSEQNQLQFPGIFQQTIKKTLNNIGYLIAIIPFSIIFYLWYRHGRDYRYASDQIYYKPENQTTKLVSPFSRPHLPMVYAPIQDLTPAQIGTIFDQKVDLHDIVAEIVELARLKYLNIIKLETKKLFSKSTDYAFIRTSLSTKEAVTSSLPKSGNKGEFNKSTLTTYQSFLLDKLFSDKYIEASSKKLNKLKNKNYQLKTHQAVLLSQLKNSFYTHLDEFRKKLYQNMHDSQYFTGNPEKSRQKWLGIYLGLSFLTGFAIFWWASQTYNFYPLVLEGILTVPGLILAYSMPRRTAWGYSLYRQISGLKYFIGKGKWRQQIAEKHLFLEETLPLAISLGVVDQLAKQMEDLNIKPPEYMNGFTAATLTHDLNHFESQAASQISSSPSGKSSWSGGSGFSGGSSGGGFGGGGGGSW